MRRSFFDGINDLLVAGAATEVLKNRVANLRARRARVLQQERMRGQHHAGSAVATLDGAAVHERLL